MNRRSQIISLFTKGTEVSINDISKKIIGCSVKTLQRELNDLVSEGKINRVGEKRWSKYILA
jgi:DeoR/GlpR family transcriptional regulator of sugar metabolism